MMSQNHRSAKKWKGHSDFALYAVRKNYYEAVSTLDHSEDKVASNFANLPNNCTNFASIFIAMLTY